MADHATTDPRVCVHCGKMLRTVEARHQHVRDVHKRRVSPASAILVAALSERANIEEAGE